MGISPQSLRILEEQSLAQPLPPAPHGFGMVPFPGSWSVSLLPHNVPCQMAGFRAALATGNSTLIKANDEWDACSLQSSSIKESNKLLQQQRRD